MIQLPQIIVNLSLVLSFVFLLCGCSSKSESNAESGARAQILHYANADEPKSIDPHLTTGSPDNNIMINLFEGLTTKDHKTLIPKPGAAERWEISEDGLKYRFHLRKNARWSNGDPVTADDFIYSWKRAVTPELPNLYSYMLFYIRGVKAYYNGEHADFSKVGVKAVDDYTLDVELVNPTHFFLQLLDHHSFYPVHKATIEKHGGIADANSRWTLPANFVGNGPFVISDWQVNKVITLSKNESYWDKGVVRLNKVHFYPIDDQQAEERAFRSGKVHLTNSPQMDIEKVAVYRKEHPEVLRVVPTYTSYYYEFNTAKAPLDNVKVRKAIAYAIDRQLIVDKVTKAGEVPSYSLTPPDDQYFQPKKYFSYDPQKAKQLLAEAGYPNGEGFPGFSILYNTNDNHRKVALAIQQMLKANLNINVQLENQEWKVYMATRNNREHQVARAGWLADYLDPSNFFDILRSYSGNNRTEWASKEYDDLMLEIEAASDIQERRVLFEKANKILFDDMPIVPIYYYSDVNLVSTMVKNWFDNPMHFHPLKEVYLDPSALIDEQGED